MVYDYEAAKSKMTRQTIEQRPQSMWRYAELLPVAGEPTVGREVASPLIKADRRQAAGIRELWIRRCSELSDAFIQGRVVSVALSRRASWALKWWPALQPATLPIA